MWRWQNTVKMYTSFQKFLPTIFAISSRLRFIGGFSFWNVAEIGCRFFSAREEGCEKNVVKADEQERVTRETQEREMYTIFKTGWTVSLIVHLSSVYPLLQCTKYQSLYISIPLVVWEVWRLLREMQRMRSSDCLDDHTLWILLDSCSIDWVILK